MFSFHSPLRRSLLHVKERIYVTMIAELFQILQTSKSNDWFPNHAVSNFSCVTLLYFQTENQFLKCCIPLQICNSLFQ